jgi:hypothetical protein
LALGPLNGLLQAVRDAQTTGPVVSRLSIDEIDLVGTDGEPLPEPWPADANDPPAFDPKMRSEALRGVDAMIAGLESLARDLAQPSSAAIAAAPSTGVARTPAQLVDDVVHTAADGIEDLAAGLMRANELASVAERVTNRATLLALNAALEATRSGSEAFAAIAEETRRLAEFAREATDTISRLAGEIEYKVGETITAIHSTSEDAKLAVAALSNSTPLASIASPAQRQAVKALLVRARDVRKHLTAKLTERDDSGPNSDSGESNEAQVSGSATGHRGSMLEEPAPPSHAEDLSQEEPAPSRVKSKKISLAAALDLDGAAPSSGEETPPEHALLLERLKPAPGYPG